MEDVIFKDKIKELFDKNELRRLEKAVKDKNRAKVADWAKQFEEQVKQQYEKAFEDKFKNDLEASIEIFMIAIAYALHFNEKTKFGARRLKDFMSDLATTVDMFRTGEFNSGDYIKALAEDGIELGNKNKGGDSD